MGNKNDQKMRARLIIATNSIIRNRMIIRRIMIIIKRTRTIIMTRVTVIIMIRSGERREHKDVYIERDSEITTYIYG